MFIFASQELKNTFRHVNSSSNIKINQPTLFSFNSNTTILIKSSFTFYYYCSSSITLVLTVIIYKVIPFVSCSYTFWLMKCSMVFYYDELSLQNSIPKIRLQCWKCKKRDLSMQSEAVSKAWRKVKGWFCYFKGDAQSKTVHCLWQKMEVFWHWY